VFTGTAFHTWRLRRDPQGHLRVAAQLVDGFSDLNGTLPVSSPDPTKA
jgi:hypothetical protein